MLDRIITKNKSESLKFIAVILMILLHTFAFPERIDKFGFISFFTINNVPVEVYIGRFGEICVSIFIFLSGYGMYIKYRDNSCIYKNIFNKLFKFYINYWTVFMIFIPIGIYMNKYVLNLKQLLLNFIGLKSTYNGEWWFIRLYIMLILLYPVFVKLICKYNKYWILILSFLMNIIGFGATKIFINIGNKYIIFDLISILIGGQFLFLLGIIVAKYGIFNNWNIKLNLSKNIYCIITFVISITIAILVNISIVGEISKLILVPILCYTIANSINDNNILSNFGKYSTNMWLMHSFFIYYLFQDFTFKLKYSVLILIG